MRFTKCHQIRVVNRIFLAAGEHDAEGDEGIGVKKFVELVFHRLIVAFDGRIAKSRTLLICRLGMGWKET